MEKSIVQNTVVAPLLDDQSENNCIKLAEQLLYRVKRKKSIDHLITKLDQLSLEELKNELNSDIKKKSFWINIYNAFSQYQMSKEKVGKSMFSQWVFFQKKFISVGRYSLSLNNIEHNLLRRSRFWWSRGYLKNPFPSKFDKSFRVDTLDPRIHFALNCGAKSCPPIRFYEFKVADEQLHLATDSYLEQESEYDASKDELILPGIVSFYLGDFGKKESRIKFIKTYLEEVGITTNTKIKYKKFDRSGHLGNYSS